MDSSDASVNSTHFNMLSDCSVIMLPTPSLLLLSWTPRIPLSIDSTPRSVIRSNHPMSIIVSRRQYRPIDDSAASVSSEHDDKFNFVMCRQPDDDDDDDVVNNRSIPSSVTNLSPLISNSINSFIPAPIAASAPSLTPVHRAIVRFVMPIYLSTIDAIPTHVIMGQSFSARVVNSGHDATRIGRIASSHTSSQPLSSSVVKLEHE